MRTVAENRSLILQIIKSVVGARVDDIIEEDGKVIGHVAFGRNEWSTIRIGTLTLTENTIEYHGSRIGNFKHALCEPESIALITKAIDDTIDAHNTYVFNPIDMLPKLAGKRHNGSA